MTSPAQQLSLLIPDHAPSITDWIGAACSAGALIVAGVAAYFAWRASSRANQTALDSFVVNALTALAAHIRESWSTNADSRNRLHVLKRISDSSSGVIRAQQIVDSASGSRAQLHAQMFYALLPTDLIGELETERLWTQAFEGFINDHEQSRVLLGQYKSARLFLGARDLT